MGIDIGSSACKAVILKDGDEIVGTFKVAVGTGTTGPNRAFEGVLESAGLSAADEIDYVLATGYGRNTFERADAQMSELSCHAKGANHLFPDVRTVIDIGGQDVKVIQIDHGAMVNFQMNDKCAAGTGRFLDVMARILEVDVSDLASLAAKSTKKIAISSTCTVFAESEVISQLANGEKKEDVVNGIHYAITARVVGLARRVGIRDRVVMTGGVAQNAGVVKALQDQLEHEVSTSPLSQYVGALGAALYAYSKANRK
ncbi:acyl-CoA dehydratase activase [Levyella massiliensis]|uniref:acyl-CoA dehydratase activase n=1 Tax=Levyella massiliensis TaxID=938289 RepID=UPI0023F289ED|nr:acyl-CoA dehydratase activase [Levyella massiliensis]